MSMYEKNNNEVHCANTESIFQKRVMQEVAEA